MTQPNENAFPVTDGTRTVEPGLTKREYFAALALQGMLANQTRGTTTDPSFFASEAVKASDALITELDKKQ